MGIGIAVMAVILPVRTTDIMVIIITVIITITVTTLVPITTIMGIILPIGPGFIHRFGGPLADIQWVGVVREADSVPAFGIGEHLQEGKRTIRFPLVYF